MKRAPVNSDFAELIVESVRGYYAEHYAPCHRDDVVQWLERFGQEGKTPGFITLAEMRALESQNLSAGYTVQSGGPDKVVYGLTTFGLAVREALR
jgi:hypothetical protein